MSVQRRIIGATGIMMGGILASRILGLVRDIVIAHQFGQGFDTDVYNAAFTIPDLMFFLVAGGALSGAFIPVFTEYVATGREKEAWRIFSVVAAVMTVVVTIFILLGEAFTPALVVVTNPGYAAAKIAATVPLTRIILPAQLCFFLGGLMMGTLQARHHFVAPALGPVIYNLGTIMGAVLLAASLGVKGLCWGALTGAIIGNLGLQWYMVRRTGGHLSRVDLREGLRHPGVRKVWILMLPVILGLALPQVSTIIGKIFASTLGDGPQSALMYANKLMQVPLGIFAQATAQAIFPTMAAQAALKDIAALRRSVNFGVRSILFLTIPSSVAMFILALPIVQLLFHGGRYTTADAELAAGVLRYFAVGIFAWSAHAIITRGFYAMQDSRTPVIVGTAVTFIFIPLNWPLRNLMGVEGLALATSIAATIHMLSMLVLLRRRLHGIDGGRLVKSVSRMLAASAVAAAACLYVRDAAQRVLVARAGLAAAHGRHAAHVRMDAAVVLLAALAAFALSYGALAFLLQMDEVAFVRRLGRRPATARA